MIGGIRTKRFAMGQMHTKANAIAIGPSLPCLPRLLTETRRDLKTCKAWIIACRRYLYDIPMHQFGFAFHAIQIVYGGAGADAHGLSPLVVQERSTGCEWRQFPGPE
jgi:hypothetical protein